MSYVSDTSIQLRAGQMDPSTTVWITSCSFSGSKFHIRKDCSNLQRGEARAVEIGTQFADSCCCSHCLRHLSLVEQEGEL